MQSKKYKSNIALDPEKVEELIEEIANYPELYWIKHDKYKNEKWKSEVYTQIAARLGISAALAKSTWTSIQEQHKEETKTLKGLEAKSGAGADEIVESSWPLWKSLQFLRDKQIPIYTTGNLEGLFKKKSRTVETPAPCSSIYQPSLHANSMQQQTNSTVASRAAIQQSSNSMLTATRASEDVNVNIDSMYFDALILHAQCVRQEDKLPMWNEINQIVDKYAYHSKPVEAPNVFMDNMFGPFIPNPKFFTPIKREPEPPKKKREKRPRHKPDKPESSDSSDCYIVEDEQEVRPPPPKIKVKKEKDEKAPARRGGAASSTPKQKNTLSPHDLQKQINTLQSQLLKMQRNSLGMQFEPETDDFSLLQPLQAISPQQMYSDDQNVMQETDSLESDEFLPQQIAMHQQAKNLVNQQRQKQQLQFQQQQKQQQLQQRQQQHQQLQRQQLHQQQLQIEQQQQQLQLEQQRQQQFQRQQLQQEQQKIYLQIKQQQHQKQKKMQQQGLINIFQPQQEEAGSTCKKLQPISTLKYQLHSSNELLSESLLDEQPTSCMPFNLLANQHQQQQQLVLLNKPKVLKVSNIQKKLRKAPLVEESTENLTEESSKENTNPSDL